MNTPSTPNMKQIVFAIPRTSKDGERKKKDWWMKAGVAFENRDGSYTLKFDVFPAHPDITIQLRDFTPKDAKDDEEAAAQ